jgi:hypothetical protein
MSAKWLVQTLLDREFYCSIIDPEAEFDRAATWKTEPFYKAYIHVLEFTYPRARLSPGSGSDSKVELCSVSEQLSWTRSWRGFVDLLDKTMNVFDVHHISEFWRVGSMSTKAEDVCEIVSAMDSIVEHDSESVVRIVRLLFEYHSDFRNDTLASLFPFVIMTWGLYLVSKQYFHMRHVYLCTHLAWLCLRRKAEFDRIFACAPTFDRMGRLDRNEQVSVVIGLDFTAARTSDVRVNALSRKRSREKQTPMA